MPSWPSRQALPPKAAEPDEFDVIPESAPVKFELDDFDAIPSLAPVKFDSGEHADIPSECSLKFSAEPNAVAYSGKAEEPATPVLHTIDVVEKGKKKKIKLTFAKCIAVAGDFYVYEREFEPGTTTESAKGKWGYPIGYAKTFSEQQARIRGGVINMMKDEGDLWTKKWISYDQLFGVFNIAGADYNGLEIYLSNEMSMIERVLEDKAEKGGPNAEEKGVHNISLLWSTYDVEVGKLMDTTSQVMRFGKDRYGGILIYNVDHFGEDAWTAYRAAHSEALKLARNGKGDPKQLKLAYLHDAFGLHYLSDQFAAGHTRCPRSEMNWPSLAGKISAFVNATTGAVYSAVWDKMTNIIHDSDNAVGVRASNLNGDQWISYGDKQYFSAPNRVNRLKSIECVQASIDEVYDTWVNGKYPSYIAADGEITQGTNQFKALRIAPLPISYTIQKHNIEKDGNPSSLWLTERNPFEADQRMQERGDISPPTPKELPPAVCTTSPTTRRDASANGYWFLRRADPDDCASFDYQYGYPGYEYGKAGPDVGACEGSDLFQYDRVPKETRALELLAGGFLQIQEYRQDATKVNYAVNVWGPVELPINYIKQERANEVGKEFSEEYRKKLAETDRQMSFTWRGRREDLVLGGETYTDQANINFRWRSWTDPSRKKIVLLKFSFSKSANAIVVDAWALDDNDKKTEQQFAQYETMKRLEFGSQPVIQKTIVRSDFSLADWTSFAMLTRFFVFPFRQGSTPSKPDIVVFSWKLEATQSIETIATKYSTGFIKRFEDVNNRPMILFARALNNGTAGIVIKPQIFEQSGNQDAISSQFKFGQEVKMPAIEAPKEGVESFYQILTGDTRRSGHREMIVLSGGWLKSWYISSWELSGDSDHKWNNVSNTMSQQVAAKPASKITSVRWKEIMKDQNDTSVKHKFCALIPNESRDESKKGKSNGLNVLMVSVYQNNSGLMTLNFRTFVKDDTSTWLTVTDDAKPAAAAAAASTSASSGAPKLVLVRWEDGTETTVPPSFFTPPSTDYNGNDTMQVIKASDNPFNSKLKTGSVLPAIPPYKWQQGWSTSTEKGDYKYTSDFRPQTPRKDYGGYEAIAGDSNRSNDGRKSQVKPNPRWDEGTLDFFNADNPWFRDEMGGAVMHFRGCGYKEQPNRDTDGAMVAEYFFDRTTNRPYAILYKLSRSYRYRVTNPAEFFRVYAKDPPAGTPAPIPPINAMPTVAAKPTPAPRPHAGWTEYYDCFIRDPYVQKGWNRSTKDHFHDMGWRLCRVASLVAKIPMYGVMNIFSFHGVLGCRVFAPREPGEYDKWVLRGFCPYLGQHSIGTGYDSTGRWNDNISELSWGATEDFHDINYWNPDGGYKCWHTCTTQVDSFSKRGFEVKKPRPELKEKK